MFLNSALTLLTIAAAKELGGTVHYHTDRLDRQNYRESSAQLCNDDSLCLLQKRKESNNHHVPVLLPPLHELERRQKVASVQRLYIASQHYQPHIEHSSSSKGRSYNISHSRITYDYGVNSPKTQLAYRVSPTSPPRSSANRVPHQNARHFRFYNRPPVQDTVRVIYNDTCIRCPSRQLARVARNERLAKVPPPKLRFCARPDDYITNFPLMVLQGPLMGSHVGEGEHTITFKTLVPLPAKTCRYTLKVFSLRCPTLPLLMHGSFYCTNENVWGSRCLFKCDTGYSSLRNHSTPYKCVKRGREATWKAPSVLPQCVGKVSTTTTSSTTSSTTVAPPKPIQMTKRRVACRWPRTPKNGWSTCGQRGRWKKRLFVKENVPCYRGCLDGFLTSVSLDLPDRNQISCVGGAWQGFKEFECLPPPPPPSPPPPSPPPPSPPPSPPPPSPPTPSPPPPSPPPPSPPPPPLTPPPPPPIENNNNNNNNNQSSNECQRIAEETPNVHCEELSKEILCSLECPQGSVVPLKFKSRAEVRCDDKDDLEHDWPPCKELVPPVLVEGCDNVFIRNVTFPVEVQAPIYQSSFAEAEVEVVCNVSFIDSFGRIPVSCTAQDSELLTEATCSFQVFSQATSCKRFTPGNHVIPKCMFPTGQTVDFPEIDTFPVNSLCEFICSSGYVISSSRIVDSFTECTEDGVWSLDNFDLCRPQVKPKQIVPCRNLTISTEQMPEGGLDFETGTYEDVFHERIEPVCVPPKVLAIGTNDIECHFDDIELRTRATCEFKVTVNIQKTPDEGY